jgi:hypothetical protein
MNDRAAAFLATLAFVATSLAPSRAEEPIEELVVAGEQPGPGLWQVRHGDNTLWILGTVTPTPAKMRWRSKEVERRIAESQLYLTGVEIDSDIGLFKAVRLLPAALRARKLPKGQRLGDVLEPALHTRWKTLQQQYLPKDDLEGFRPLFAIYPIYARVLRNAGLEESGDVAATALRLAKKAGIAVREPQLTVSIEDPRALLREYTESSPGVESGCFERLATRIERDVPLLQQRAEAWAKGDVAVLRRLSGELASDECLNFLSALPRIAAIFDETLQRTRQEWLLAAEGALLSHRSSFATVRLDELLRDDGYLSRLKARGYVVVEPE